MTEPHRVVGSPWRCQRCDVGITSPHKPVCWNCNQADEMVPSHQYHAPTSAAWLHPMLNHINQQESP